MEMVDESLRSIVFSSLELTPHSSAVDNRERVCGTASASFREHTKLLGRNRERMPGV